MYARPARPRAVGERRGRQSNDLRLLLGFMGAPLAPVYVCAAEPLPNLSIKDTPIETSSAHYILQQYLAASSPQKLLAPVCNAYAIGKVRMVPNEFETIGRVIKIHGAARCVELRRFVLWQMAPRCGTSSWPSTAARCTPAATASSCGAGHTSWLGAHTAKSPICPVRRALQV